MISVFLVFIEGDLISFTIVKGNILLVLTRKTLKIAKREEKKLKCGTKKDLPVYL